jgi:hypothetical protein
VQITFGGPECHYSIGTGPFSKHPASAQGVTYSYDSARRLAAANYGALGTVTYTYDSAGHLITRAAPAPVLAIAKTHSGNFTQGQKRRGLHHHGKQYRHPSDQSGRSGIGHPAHRVDGRVGSGNRVDVYHRPSGKLQPQ